MVMSLEMHQTYSLKFSNFKSIAIVIQKLNCENTKHYIIVGKFFLADVNLFSIAKHFADTKCFA